jgi:hypothetical protein
MKVRVGSLYAFQPVGLDLFDSRVNVPVGTIVRVVNKYGCPPANTMGHCYIEYPDDKEFIGLVMCASLEPIKRIGKKYHYRD